MLIENGETHDLFFTTLGREYHLSGMKYDGCL